MWNGERFRHSTPTTPMAAWATWLADAPAGRRKLAAVVVRDADTNINLLPFVAPGSRRNGSLREADVKKAFEQTKSFDMVIVAAIRLNGEPCTRLFASLVDHIILVARADEQNTEAIERLMADLGRDARKVRGAVLTGVGTAGVRAATAARDAG